MDVFAIRRNIGAAPAEAAAAYIMRSLSTQWADIWGELHPTYAYWDC